MQAGGGWIPIPERIAKAKAVINPHNNDDYCFIYAVQLGLVDFSHEHNCWRITYLQNLSESRCLHQLQLGDAGGANRQELQEFEKRIPSST